jgi:hypothetical protein
MGPLATHFHKDVVLPHRNRKKHKKIMSPDSLNFPVQTEA